MCKPASFVATKDRVYWSEKTDSHHEIISEHELCENGIRGVNVVPLEITPENGNLSLPLKKWKFAIDFAGFARDLPEWWNAEKYEAMARAELKNWAAIKLKGWKVKEAFNPINPLMQKQDKTLDLKALLLDYASVHDSVRASVRASVRDSVHASVYASVHASVYDSVHAYIGSLFHNITKWKYCPDNMKHPWKSLRKLWLGGFVPSFDGKTWRLHAGLKAKVVFEISAEELRK